MQTDDQISIRLVDITTMAVKTFGSESIANAWLNKSNFTLGCTPLEAAQTESGAAKVQEILSAVSYGGVV